MITTTDPAFVRTAALGANWRLQFTDPDGSPLNMGSFEAINFGAISYFEIFQNVKTILATPLFSAALERTLGVDQGIVDRPITEASYVTVAILDALTFWEPRVQVIDIEFDADPLDGHLIVNLKLSIRNVIYGTDTPYDKIHISDTPTGDYAPELKTWQDVQPHVKVVAAPVKVPMPGPSGPPGERGSLWFEGTGVPVGIANAQSQDMYLDDATGDVYQYDGLTWLKRI